MRRGAIRAFFVWQSQAVNQRCHVACSESVIDVHDSDVGRAGIHHAEQGRESFKCGTITDAGRHGDNRNANKAADDAGQCTFHAGADDDDSRLGERFPMREKAMDARHADVIKMLDVITHHFSGNDRLFGNRYVTRARRNNGDRSLPELLVVALQNNCSGQFTILCLPDFLLYDSELLFGGSRGEKIAAMLGQAFKDRRHPRGSLPFSEDNLWHADPECAVVIDFGKFEVLKWQMSQTSNRLIGREFSIPHLME